MITSCHGWEITHFAGGDDAAKRAILANETATLNFLGSWQAIHPSALNHARHSLSPQNATPTKHVSCRSEQLTMGDLQRFTEIGGLKLDKQPVCSNSLANESERQRQTQL